MRTSITTFQERIQGDLHFPVLTKYGIVDDKDLGVYYNLLDDSGYTLSIAERNAIENFLAKGTEQGWRDKMLYVMPLIGSQSAPSAVACPLIARVGSQEKATLGVSGSYDGSSDYTDILSLDGNAVVGIKGGSKVLSLHLTALDLFTKFETSILSNKTQHGIILYGDFAKEGVENNAFGIQPEGLVDNGVDSIVLAGINIPNSFRVGIFGEEIVYANPAQNNNHFLATNFAGTLRNLIRFYYGDLEDIEYNQDSQRNYPDHVNVSIASTSRVTVGGAYTNASLSLNASKTLKNDLRFFAITDGTLSESATRSFAQELKVLLSAFGKLY